MTEIKKYHDHGIIHNFDDAERAARAMAQSGFFKDARQASQAIVKILAGQEMGFGPFASMNGIYIILGRPAISSNLMAAAVKDNERYDYRVTEITDARCAITFYENGEPIGESVFTIEDARKAGTQNIQKFPRNMLFARALSNGVRWFCPNVFISGPVYVPEELGANTDENGYIDVQVAKEQVSDAETEAQKLYADGETIEQIAERLNKPVVLVQKWLG